jgi:hypothetical protein
MRKCSDYLERQLNEKQRKIMHDATELKSWSKKNG